MSTGEPIAERLRGLVVSCQPVTGGPMDRPDIVAALALAAIAGGAAALRIEGLANLRAVRAATAHPLIGLVKRAEPGHAIYITPRVRDVAALCEAGADVVAFDATLRDRPEPVAALIAAAHRHGALAMADTAAGPDGAAAASAGADILASTLSGYVGGPVPDDPDVDLVAALARLGRPVLAEGRYRTGAQLRAALDAGARAVVVGSAITRVEHITAWFAAAAAPPRP